ncbi:hypothetical protein [Paenibacillus silvae]|uniref:hypothetical protein n=1 Tax=Paenibacillus silvae TaxID=1325358 RepID=UPI0020047DCC|nr:hypothetical protein [Paenibacillus silvae]MCK6075358.1 hypothetical protein [Paenibacillus silvae]MCK6149745.1 hypothetical protein [Paenibacillus silvae]MCK6268043.1 hypothetical protein [Paenibacillus silvae]
MSEKIRVELLDKDLKSIVKEFGWDEIESELENNQPGTVNIMNNTCDDKTIASLDLPDGIGGGLLHPHVLWRRYRLYAEYCYPSDAEQALKDAVTQCFLNAVAAAVAAAGLANLTPAGISAALPAAKAAFVETFKSCMGDKLTDAISFDVKYDSYRR